MAKPAIKDMLDNVVHIGSQANLWSPRMKDYIHGAQNGTHVFDLNITADHLEEMKTALEAFCKAGKELVIVGSKIQAQEIAKKLAIDTGHHYVTSVWVPGLITNFPTIKKRINTFNRIAKDIETGKIEELSKKEKAKEIVEYERLKKRYDGLKNIKRLPDGVLVLDGHFERNAVKEANVVKIPVFGLLGTTGNPELCAHFAPCNVNTVKSLVYVTEYLKPVMKKQARAPMQRPANSRGGHNGAPRKPRPAASAPKKEAPKTEEK